jgi:hypothetical protein
MELLFADKRLQDTLESRVRVDAHFGASDGALVRQRVCELLAADSLAVVAQLRTLDLKPVDSAADCFTTQLTPRLRLRFELASDSGPAGRAHRRVDLSEVHALRVVGIEETQ